MKILIMVLSFDNPPYDALMRSQQATWDSVYVDGINTMYYYGNVQAPGYKVNHIHNWSCEYGFNCTDAYYYMAGKFQKALEAVSDQNYELIFRTNSSSYVNKTKLVEFAKKLPLEKCYAGWEIQANEGFNIVSGAGIFLSKDVAEILENEIDPLFEKEEDYYIGQILSGHNIPIIDDKSRVDYPSKGGYDQAYHIRFKTYDRIADARHMRTVHNLIKHK